VFRDLSQCAARAPEGLHYLDCVLLLGIGHQHNAVIGQVKPEPNPAAALAVANLMLKHFLCPFADSLSLPLRDGNQDVEDESAGGRASVDGIADGEKLLTAALTEITVDQGLPVGY
jgi:hypothetical protein